ncbi:hypothetical protein BKA56DRAFT_669461 [Ilyonectria sp. MPI-CAGE-AT-0026]|nr:hypothetical protein BKA56DRAFT_669461 [Ilyonectria sp. MPI-CAGE-AT-0026]
MPPPSPQKVTATELEKRIRDADLSMDLLTEANLDPVQVSFLSPSSQRTVLALMVDEIFSLAHRDPKDYLVCWTACVEKLGATNVLTARTFSSWGGHKQLTIDLQNLESLKKETPGINMLPATTIVAASATKNIHRVRDSEKDKASEMLKANDLWSYVDAAIDAYTTYKKRIFMIEVSEKFPDGPIFRELDNGTPVMKVPGSIPNEVQSMMELGDCQVGMSRLMALFPEPEMMEIQKKTT